jgi:hypothetical protein
MTSVLGSMNPSEVDQSTQVPDAAIDSHTHSSIFSETDINSSTFLGEVERNDHDSSYSSFISSGLSVPNPKRANAIDFLGISENHGTTNHGKTQNENYGSSFSHLSTESRSELSSIGVRVSRMRSADEPTPDIDSLEFSQRQLAWQHNSQSDLNLLITPSAVQSNPLDLLQQRGLSPKPVSSIPSLGSAGSDWKPSNVVSEFKNTETLSDSRSWMFTEKPPGLLSRATSSLGISLASNNQQAVSNMLTRPVSTPAYFSNLSSVSLGLGFHIQSNATVHSSFFEQQTTLDAVIPPLNDSDVPKSYSPFGSDFPHLNLALSGGHHRSSENPEESRWPKPVRYSRPLESTETMLSSIIRPPSTNDLARSSINLSPMSNTDRLSVSPKPNSYHRHYEGVMPLSAQSVSREITPPPTNSRVSPKLSINNVDDRAIENVIATNCHHILMDAADHSLKAVELANTLRARVGTEVLALVRERWGGLLSLLERHPEKFFVERIPKNDRVSLYTSALAAAAAATALQNQQLDAANLESNDQAHPFSSMESSNEELGSDSQLASRCLHVGNVPSNFTEVQLMNEFEKFGQLDGLKLINQKNGNRRFAFVTYKTVAQAVTARHCLSKIHPWKSAISFAHRDFSNNTTTSNNSNNNSQSTNSAAVSQNGAQQSFLLKQNKLINSSHNNNQNFGQMSEEKNNAWNNIQQSRYQQAGQHYSDNSFHHQQLNYQVQQQHHNTHNPHQNAHAQHHQNGDQNNRFIQSLDHFDRNLLRGHQQHRQDRQHFPSEDLSRSGNSVNAYSAGATKTVNSFSVLNQTQNSGVMKIANYSNQHQQHANLHPHHPPLIGQHPRIENFSDKNALQIILTRLCDDTYVPTQPWPVDSIADDPFCQAVIDQVSHFGGSTTISKLRGFLKHRVGTSDNIKSVPLKALLLAYPSFFKVEGNLVTLVNHASSSSNANPQP